MSQHRAPPIQWLVVFDAVASTLSFKKAADQLHVSPPAVSQQIKSLEDWLGEPLFERHARRISLTAAGSYYQDVSHKIVRAHKQGYQEFLRRFQSRSLHVSAPLYIAQELMIPHYLTFKDYLPETELRIEARSSYVDFDIEPLDAAIRFGNGDWPELNCRPLCNIALSPVCSPEYARTHRLESLTDLHAQQLISPTADLAQWRLLLGESASQEADILICDSYLAALKAASEGLGVTLALLPSTNAWIDDGRLVLPFDIKIPTVSGYWLVAPKRSQRGDSLEALYQWACSLFDDLGDVDQRLTEISIPISGDTDS
ncbi:transcriptional regulator GcvA [Maricurvus nonylphenolicus]|uniref:LysR family transcriptional regulator n=1 Tax=Maricurvus nonylphenolicus TaxID=1008307 RepID=UPI0036F40081